MWRSGFAGDEKVGVWRIHPDQKQMIVADGRQLECQWIGVETSAEPVLVFLHEGLGCIDLWRDFPGRLCDELEMRGFIYSRAGYGGSDLCELPRPVSFMHHEGQVVLSQVLDAAGIDKAILIGHSDGGSISLIHAGNDKTDRICAVITLAAHVFNEDICVESIKAAKVAYEEGDLRARLKKYHGENVDNAFRGWNDVWLHRDFRKWNIEGFLPDINVPVLVVQGINDPYGTQAQIEAIVTGVGSGVEKHIIPDCGHSPHLEQGQITREIIASFIDGLV